MNLKFTAVKEENKVEVTFDKEKLTFSLSDKNNVSNDDIVKMLTNIAKEISAGNFDKKKNVEVSDPEELGELKGLYEFVYSLFISFVDKFNKELETYPEDLESHINRKQTTLKRDF